MDLGVEMLGALPTTRAGPRLVMAGLTATGLVIGLTPAGLAVTGLTPTDEIVVTSRAVGGFLYRFC